MTRHVGVVTDPSYYKEFQRGSVTLIMCPKCDQEIKICEEFHPELTAGIYMYFPEHQCNVDIARRNFLIRRIFQ